MIADEEATCPRRSGDDGVMLRNSMTNGSWR